VSNQKLAVWFLTVRTGTGTDVFTERLAKDLNREGIRAEITWLPLRAEYAPWTVKVPKQPEWATVAHVNTWLHSRFLPAKLPTLATIHHSIHDTTLAPYKGWLRGAYHRWWIAPNERRVLNRADNVTAVSQFVADTARKTLCNVPMQVIYNGVDTNLFFPGTRVREPDEPFILIYIGSWIARKGVDLLAPIMRELGDNFELRYTGGADSDKDKSDMPRNMIDIGRLHGDAAVAAALQQSDALLFPSRSEGFGLVAAEAMACGLPVIATKGSSLLELVIDGKTGFLVNQDDTSCFATAATCLARKDALYKKISCAAKDHSISAFSNSKFLKSYIDAYKKILNL
jgi:glycosyltransferase involved in cell wall biosynthesis